MLPGMDKEIAERPSTATEYFCQDFKWEDLRNEVQSQLSFGLQDFDNVSINSRVCLDYNVEAWNSFHHLHAKHAFFKERRYLVKEFPDLLASDRVLNILEIGCGTGSSVLPILRANKAAVVYGCDCSESVLRRAQDLVQSTISSDGRCQFVPFLCDISIQRLPTWLCAPCVDSEGSISKDRVSLENDKQLQCTNGIDIVTMIFTLSSIPPKQMQHVIRECFSVLKPGGLVLFRDYGLYDMTMQRFSPTQRVGERLYQRGDGTLTYFFTPEVLKKLFTEAGFVEEENYFCCVELRNRRRELPMKRVWIHAKFIKP